MPSVKECVVPFCISPYLMLYVTTAACADSMGHNEVYSYVPNTVNMPSVQEEVPSVISADPTLPWFQVPYTPVAVGPPESPPVTANTGNSVKTGVTHIVHAPAVVSAAAASAVVVGASATTGLASSSTHPLKMLKSASSENVAENTPASAAVHYIPPPPLAARLPPLFLHHPTDLHHSQGVASVAHALSHAQSQVVLAPAPSVVAVDAPAAVVARPAPSKPCTKQPTVKSGKMVTLNGYHSNSFVVAHAPTVVQIAQPPLIVKTPPSPKTSPKPVTTKVTKKVLQNNSPARPARPILFLPSPTIVNVNVHQAPVINANKKGASPKPPPEIKYKNITIPVVVTPAPKKVQPGPFNMPVAKLPTSKPTTRPTKKIVAKKLPQSTPRPSVPTTSRRPKAPKFPASPKPKRPTTTKVPTRPPVTLRTRTVPKRTTTARPKPSSTPKRNTTKSPKVKVTRPIKSALVVPPAAGTRDPTLVHVGMDRKSSTKSDGIIKKIKAERNPTVLKVGMNREGSVKSSIIKQTSQRDPTLVHVGMTGKGSVQSGIFKHSGSQGGPTMLKFGMTRKGSIQAGLLKGESTLHGRATVVRVPAPVNGSLHSGLLKGSILHGALNFSGHVNRSRSVVFERPSTDGKLDIKEVLKSDRPRLTSLFSTSPRDRSAKEGTNPIGSDKPASPVGMNPEIFKLAAELTSTTLSQAMAAAGAAASAVVAGHPLGLPKDIIVEPAVAAMPSILHHVPPVAIP